MIKKSRAYTLSTVLIFLTVFSILLAATVTYISRHIKTTSTYQKRTTALGIAEAGVNYYLWHLSHNPEDYCDGQTCQGEPPYGPYEHEYKDN